MIENSYCQKGDWQDPPKGFGIRLLISEIEFQRITLEIGPILSYKALLRISDIILQELPEMADVNSPQAREIAWRSTRISLSAH